MLQRQGRGQATHIDRPEADGRQQVGNGVLGRLVVAGNEPVELDPLDRGRDLVSDLVDGGERHREDNQIGFARGLLVRPGGRAASLRRCLAGVGIGVGDNDRVAGAGDRPGDGAAGLAGSDDRNLHVYPVSACSSR